MNDPLLMRNVILVLHNVYGVELVKQMAKLAYGFKVNVFVVSKPAATASQVGVPEVQKFSFKLKKSFLALSDLPDVIELLEPVEVFLFTSKAYAKECFDPSRVAPSLVNGKVLFVFGGSESGLSAKELDMGRSVYLEEVNGDVGPIGMAAIALYKTLKVLQETTRKS